MMRKMGIFALALFPVTGMAVDRALLIGVGQYANPDQVPNLGGPPQDVKLMRELALSSLDFKPEQILSLVNAQATRNGIVAGFEKWLIQGTQPGDRVFIAYSGHGAQITDRDGDELDNLDETLVPHDVAVVNGRVLNMITDDEINNWLIQLQDRIVTMVVDACHSGTVTRAIGNGPEHGLARTFSLPTREALNPDQVSAHRGEESLVPSTGQLTVWTAASSYQKAFDDTEANPRSGAFTNRFVRAVSTGIADADENGETSHAELLAWLRRESSAYCERNRRICRDDLTPTLEINPEWLAQPIDVTLKAEAIHNLSVADIADELLQAESLLDTGDTGDGAQPANMSLLANQNQQPNSSQLSGNSPESPAASATPAPKPSPLQKPPPSPATASTAATHETQTILPAATHNTPPPATAPPSKPFELNLQIVDRLKRTDRDRFARGDEIHFRVKSPVNGYLTILNIDADGKLQQFFPSHEVGMDTRIPRETWINWPGTKAGSWVGVGEPYGQNVLIALVTQDAIDLSEIQREHSDMETIPNPEEYLSLIGKSLRKTWQGHEKNRAAHWASKIIRYETSR